MTLGIYYNPVKTPEAAREIFGLQVAVLDWLKAWFRFGHEEKFHFLINSKQALEELHETAAAVDVDKNRIVALDQRFTRENLGQFSTILRLVPDCQRLLWQRQSMPGSSFTFCGLAHALSGMETGELLEQYCLSPSEETDAIVCPSRAARSAISTFWDMYSDYLRMRFGANYHCPVQLPIIPLGIDIDKFADLGRTDKRADQRKKLGLGDTDIVLLWVGRLSHVLKAHPLAMFQAAERAAALTGASIHLVMMGYFVPKDAEVQFQQLATDVCVKAKVKFIASNDPLYPDGLWAAGDIFLSLIDNMQESFGLTPIEAMAAGLPRVISDWDGYRDSVQHGEDGFLIKTRQPPPGMGKELATLLLSGKEVYGGYLAKTALSVAIDVDMAAQAIKLLIEDKDKRRTIIEKARIRVRNQYDWKKIILSYQQLWQEMAAKRLRDKANIAPLSWSSVMPQAPDPYSMYATYPSKPFAETDRVSLSASSETIKMLWRHEINVLAIDMMLPADDMTALINYVSKQGTTMCGDIFKQFPSFDRSRLWRALGWLIKLGIISVKDY